MYMSALWEFCYLNIQTYANTSLHVLYTVMSTWTIRLRSIPWLSLCVCVCVCVVMCEFKVQNVFELQPLLSRGDCSRVRHMSRFGYHAVSQMTLIMFL